MWTLSKNHLGLVVGMVSLTLFIGTAEAINLQSWDDQMPNNRFTVLAEFNSQAVLDRETQLVWERSPIGPISWPNAIARCYNLKLGGRMGYRLPTIEELMTLVDTAAGAQNPGLPALPPGNPFQNVQVEPYWSATTEAGSPDLAWVAVFGLGGYVAGGEKEGDQADAFNVWCVRGGHGYDAY